MFAIMLAMPLIVMLVAHLTGFHQSNFSLLVMFHSLGIKLNSMETQCVRQTWKV